MRFMALVNDLVFLFLMSKMLSDDMIHESNLPPRKEDANVHVDDILRYGEATNVLDDSDTDMDVRSRERYGTEGSTRSESDLDPTMLVTSIADATKSDLVAELPSAKLHQLDVEFVVNRTVELMSESFEERLARFLTKLERQHRTTAGSTENDVLKAKLDACERAIPRIEARLDVLADRVAATSAELSRQQKSTDAQFSQLQQQLQTRLHPYMTPGRPEAELSRSTKLTSAMNDQVESVIEARVRVTEERWQKELVQIRQLANPDSIIEAVSANLKSFRDRIENQQRKKLKEFSAITTQEAMRIDERVNQIEDQVANLEQVVQNEQEASLTALQALSEAFQGNDQQVT